MIDSIFIFSIAQNTMFQILLFTNRTKVKTQCFKYFFSQITQNTMFQILR